ncbi:MAG: S8 family serine peptidase [Proteobacteria bacterium]|nr:S8 family serine peptidase [Pseudomonadota bacterium]
MAYFLWRNGSHLAGKCSRRALLSAGLAVVLVAATGLAGAMAQGGNSPSSRAQAANSAAEGQLSSKPARAVHPQLAQRAKSTDQPAAATRALAPRAATGVPPAGEQRLLADEVVIELAGDPSQREVEALASRHRLVRIESKLMPSTGTTFYRWRIPDRRSISTVVRELEADPAVRSVQPNYVYSLQQTAAPATRSVQYALDKLRLSEAHALARGERVLVAVIDSGIDVNHPDIAGTIIDQFDALGSGEKVHAHGTGIAGIIAAHGKLTGAAPGVRIIAVRAFAVTRTGTEGTTFNIIKGLDWALDRGARLVNMSFAGPFDPALARLLSAAHAKGAILIAAVGNQGPASPPLYPAADAHVIAVTAIDADDELFAKANRGSYVDVAAPGVDILMPAPGGAYQVLSGTSFAAAYVSGIAALILERRPRLLPDALKRILLLTARDLGPKGRDTQFGEGAADAYRALMTFESKTETAASEAEGAR